MKRKAIHLRQPAVIIRLVLLDELVEPLVNAPNLSADFLAGEVQGRSNKHKTEVFGHFLHAGPFGCGRGRGHIRLCREVRLVESEQVSHSVLVSVDVVAYCSFVIITVPTHRRKAHAVGSPEVGGIS